MFFRTLRATIIFALILGGLAWIVIANPVHAPESSQPRNSLPPDPVHLSGLVITPVPEGAHARFRATTEPKFLSQWATECTHCMLINGSYFDENNIPTGYYSAEGIRMGSSTHDLQRSGLVRIDAQGRIVIEDLTKTTSEALLAIKDGLQSYPILVKNYEPAVKEDSGKRARRTALAITRDNHLLVINYFGQITLYQFAREIASALEGNQQVRIALNLDGGPSTGLVIRDMAFPDGKKTLTYDSITPVPNIIEFSQ